MLLLPLHSLSLYGLLLLLLLMGVYCFLLLLRHHLFLLNHLCILLVLTLLGVLNDMSIRAWVNLHVVTLVRHSARIWWDSFSLIFVIEVHSLKQAKKVRNSYIQIRELNSLRHIQKKNLPCILLSSIRHHTRRYYLVGLSEFPLRIHAAFLGNLLGLGTFVNTYLPFYFNLLNL